MKYIIYHFIFLFTVSSFGQIQVADVNSVESAVQQLAGDGVVIFNIKHRFTTGAKPVGSFKDDFGILGVDEGFLMTNGAAVNASGPNVSAGKTTENSSESVVFSELGALVDDDLYDLVVVEFDIQVSTDVLEFTYVFGSDEYPEFVDSYHDVFGFFISGPGIFGSKNLAVVPNTNVPVSVGTINANKNKQYYQANGTGTTPLINIDVEYDGFTKPLTAYSKVIPCQTYHIKLAIADVKDAQYDSGVFLQNNSFSAKNAPELSVKYEHDRFPYGLEDCNDFEVTIKRGTYDMQQLNQELQYSYQLGGSADRGVDYSETIPAVITIPQNQTSVTYDFSVLTDAIAEIEEEMILKISSGCPSVLEVTELVVPIRDNYEYLIDDSLLCGTNEIQLNPSPQYTDDLNWQANASLSCITCTSPIASNKQPTWYYYTAEDQISGCKTNDSVFVDYKTIQSDFDFEVRDCYTSQDLFFENKSTNATSYLWSFGDGQSADEFAPQHTYGEWMKDVVIGDYTVNLLAQNKAWNCESQSSKVVTITEELMIPNVVTPNADNKNDVLIIKGIIGECWTLSVFNRYGKQVYQNEQYQNNWNPESLSDGVYYYDLQNENGDRYFKGYVLIIR